MNSEFPSRFVRKNEGFKNPADIHDLADRESVRKEVERAFKVRTAKIEVWTEKATESQVQLVEDVVRFAEELCANYQDSFFDIIEDLQKNQKISDTILHYIEDHSLHLPSFTIAHGSSRGKLYGNIRAHVRSMRENYEPPLSNNEALVVLELPKPMSYFWWKGGVHSWGEGGKAVAPDIIEWGHLYRELMPVIWQKFGYEVCEGTLTFRRINEPGEHQPGLYYYVLRVRHRTQEERKSTDTVE